MSRVLLALMLAAGLTSGCGTDNRGQVAGPPIPAPPKPVGPAVEHPDYAAWKKFKPGTVVKRRSEVTRTDNANKVIATETLTLLELTDLQAVIERQNTVERVGEDARIDVGPAERRTVPATFTLPTGITAEEFAKPSLDAKEAGEEKVATAGQEYKCRVYKFSNGTEAGPMATTVWWSDDMPGRLVKQTMTVTGVGNNTVETVIEVKRP